MIYSVEVTNYLNESLNIELARPQKTGLAITNITGIGPAEADINMTDYAATDGGIFNSSRLQSRNIVLSVTYYGDHIESARNTTYKYFPIKKLVKLSFVTENRTACISGYVESNDVNIFSNQASAEISIVCPNPWFFGVGKDAGEVHVLSGLEGKFEFPFSNESLTESLIEMSSYKTDGLIDMFYNGDSVTGVDIEAVIRGPVGNITLINSSNQEEMSIDVSLIEEIISDSIAEGDIIYISTSIGRKSATILHMGVLYNILNSLGIEPEWITLSKGHNFITYTATEGIENVNITFKNDILYEGL